MVAVSRLRKFLADTCFVQWMRYPMDMLGVLRRTPVPAGNRDDQWPDNEAALFDSDLMERQQPLIVHMLLEEQASRQGAWMRQLLDSPPATGTVDRAPVPVWLGSVA